MKIKKVVNYLGKLLLIISLLYIINVLHDYSDFFLDYKVTSELVILVLSMSVVYALSQFLLSEAWFNSLIVIEKKEYDRAIIFKLYGESQLAKYIPGNVFQYIGRVGMAKKEGIPTQTSIYASIIEIVFVTVSSLILGIGVYSKYFKNIDSNTVKFSILILTIIILITMIFFINKKLSIYKKIIVNSYPKVIKIFFLYFFFIFFSSAIFIVYIYRLSSDFSSELYVDYFGISSTSWLVGYITPGAPSGIGVKEASMTILLSPYANESVAALIALVIRVNSILGDILFWIFSMVYTKQVCK